ncbi:hypothetical protein JQ620_09080 [Bradyrhizobium sp. AUGA SZCCT0274]|uniref:hypothetical protein n=1 Tax=Bradyrhizobium sp. AUGA SZCCT0274 TaxID=2807670 RepID=UPI001BA5F7CB|nr:hypothetical protein [Bradyrhizobium sp. AUGA SZCCT0274]MBR1240276.1 hypothetical protein [Bradyrhizobium sp. AUGA SZCCT0274]
MKLLLSDYLGSLKERGELDAILPDLLSEIGFHVISRPAIGVAQRGVDIAAVGKDRDGVRKLFLFSVKAGDLTRSEWDTGIQALRPSLNEILDEYIPQRILPQHKGLKVVICLVVGGVVQQAVQSLVTSFIKKHTTRRISFQEWNGDFIAGLLLNGPLREKLLPQPLQSSFRKAVAMVDQPDVSYEHFARLLSALRARVVKDKDRILVTRQINICLWVLFVWARETDNLDAAYRASELALLNAWDLAKPFIGKKGAGTKEMDAALEQLFALHTTVAGLFLERKILPYVGRRHALSFAVNSTEPTDVNLAMFDALGRLAATGHWMLWSWRRGGRELDDKQIATIRMLVADGFRMIGNNPSLSLPLMDEQAIELAMFLSLASQTGHVADIEGWLSEMVFRLKFAVASHSRYPTALTEYPDLLAHPRAQTDEYRQEATQASVLIPLLLAFAAGLGDMRSVATLQELVAGPLAHCTLQLWLPDEDSEKHIYLNDDYHGAGAADVPASAGGRDLLDILAATCKSPNAFDGLSAIRAGCFPLILTACRHHRKPVPPQYWFPLLAPADTATKPTG